MEITQGSVTPLPFYLALASDHVSPATGKSPVVQLSKAGGAFAAAAGAVTETGNGWYLLNATAVDTNTVGALVLHVTAAASADPVDKRHFVGSDAVLYASTSPIPIFHPLSADHVTGGTGLSPAVVISKNGAAFASPIGLVSEIGFGWYKLTPTAADTNTIGALAVHSTAATADPDDSLYAVETGANQAWGSAYLLDLFNRYASRPSVDEVTDTQKYRWLAEAQTGVVADVAARCPHVLYGPPLPLATADGGKTFTFGTDANGYPVFPMGNVRIFDSVNNVPDFPLLEGTDYLSEGTTIRVPNNRTLASTLYWRGISPPADLSATVAPSLYPEPSRNLIALEAARRFMKTQSRADLVADLAKDYQTELPRWLLVWRRQFSNGGALGGFTGLKAAMLGGGS